MPGLRTNSPAFEYYNAYAGTPAGSTSLPAREWYAYMTRSDYLQTTEFVNINFDFTDKLNVEAGMVHFHSDFKYYSPFGQFAYQPDLALRSTRAPRTSGTASSGSTTSSPTKCWCMPTFSQGFRDGGANSGFATSCYNNGVPQSLRARHDEQLRARLEDLEP